MRVIEGTAALDWQDRDEYEPTGDICPRCGQETQHRLGDDQTIETEQCSSCGWVVEFDLEGSR